MVIDLYSGEEIFDDPLNSTNSRTRANTDPYDYNCAGYALETYSWYLPCDRDTYFDALDTFEETGKTYFGSYNEFQRNALTVEFTSRILRDFPDVRMISSVKDLHPDEYAFAFRVGVDDFHFVKRGANGVWYEKRGNIPQFFRMSRERVFNTSWGSRYNGPIILMAKKRKVA